MMWLKATACPWYNHEPKFYLKKQQVAEKHATFTGQHLKVCSLESQQLYIPEIQCTWKNISSKQLTFMISGFCRPTMKHNSSWQVSVAVSSILNLLSVQIRLAFEAKDLIKFVSLFSRAQLWKFAYCPLHLAFLNCY